MNLEKNLHLKSKNQAGSTPRIFDLSKPTVRKILENLIKKRAVREVIDDYQNQLKEYFQISNPQINNPQDLENKFTYHLSVLGRKQTQVHQGKWVYFPWLGSIVHILDENEFFAVRTARNKLLITQIEQEKFYSATVGIGGLSIGSSVAIAIVLQGGARHIKLADFDTLSLSNTNRIRAGVQNLGLSKVGITARQIYEINPYAKVEIFPEGITKKNVDRFMHGLDIIIDEMDSLAIKLLIRIHAKKLKIPLLMGADNADMAVIDVERYDKNPKLAFFHNRLGKLDPQKLEQMSKLEIGKTIAQLIGLENHTERMLFSLKEMGKSIISWPQLGGTAMLNGSAIAYCARKILTGQNLTNNRGIISLDEMLSVNYFTKSQKQSRAKAIISFKKNL